MSASILATASNGLIGALVTGGVSWLIFFLTGRRRQSALEDAWKAQAEELDARLTKQYEAARKQDSEQIHYLRIELQKCQTEQQRQQKVIGRLQARDNE